MKNKCKQILGSVLAIIPLLFAAVVLRPFPWEGQGGVVWLSWAIAVLSAVISNLQQHVYTSRLPKALYPGIAIGAAVVLTLYQTSGYFDTGASGYSVHELLLSYRMFGFHPNFRTVLFSTIMMVVLITWPRKFPQFSKTLPAGVVGVVVVTALNMLLNPVAARSVVPELLPHWLPFFGRLPTSALSMLLIFAAWDNIPYARVKALFQEHRVFELTLFFALIGTLFWFHWLWVLAGAGLVCGLWRLKRITAVKNRNKMIKIGTIDPDIFEETFGKLQTNQVVLTSERRRHIYERHMQDYPLLKKYGRRTVNSPDIIMVDKKSKATVFLVKKLPDTNLNVVLRLALATDEQGLKNSIMTFHRVRDKYLKKMLNRNKTLYKRE